MYTGNVIICENWYEFDMQVGFFFLRSMDLFYRNAVNILKTVASLIQCMKGYENVSCEKKIWQNFIGLSPKFLKETNYI